MDIEFDPEKDRLNQAKHGLSLATAAAIDFESALFIPDDRYAYGEERIQMLGMIGERLDVLVFTPRGRALRAISLRKANLRERRRYARQA